ncbi:MAG: PhoH family protein [Polyangiaceae bacterium]|nr:PhoH family protein [Polyangiaceae bacterium]
MAHHKLHLERGQPRVERRSVEIDDTALLLALVGPQGVRLRELSDACGVEVGQRGTSVLLAGDPAGVAVAERFVRDTCTLLREGVGGPIDVHRSVATLKGDPSLRLRDLVDDAVVVSAPSRTIVPKGLAQRRYVQAIRSHDLSFGVGPAGTGKTYLAMAVAVAELVERRVKRIVLTRPAVEAGEKLGFLPGDMADKVDPYLRPLYDALHDMMDVERADALVARGHVEVAPLAFMRGRTLSDAFVILDEAQNTTSEQMRMFLTRIGQGTRAVVTGDVTQIDLPRGQRSGLAEAVEILRGVEGVGVTWFADGDIVRHPLVARIVRAYEARDQERRDA